MKYIYIKKQVFLTEPYELDRDANAIFELIDDLPVFVETPDDFDKTEYEKVIDRLHEVVERFKQKTERLLKNTIYRTSLLLFFLFSLLL